MSRRDDTNIIKPIINEAFVASSGDIITDYNDLYCLFTRRVAFLHDRAALLLKMQNVHLLFIITFVCLSVPILMKLNSQ